MTPHEVAQRLDNRAGYELITYREVGLPVFSVLATAMIQERQERSCIEEFSLRALAAGLTTQEQVEGILGLPSAVVESTLADLLRQEAITTNGDRVLLTARGKELADDAAGFAPSEQTIWFPYDGLLRRAKWYGGSMFLKPNEAQELGLTEVKPNPLRGPNTDELSPTEISDVLRLAVGAKPGEREVLRVVSIEKRFRQFLPAVALAYRRIGHDDIQLGFAIDGRISQEHELAFARGGGLERQQIFRELHEKPQVAISGPLSGRLGKIIDAASELRNKAARVTTSRSALDAASLAVVTSGSDSQREDATAAEKGARAELQEAQADFQRAPVRPLPVYEHPGVLEDAISTATTRVLIVSPWIRQAVVDDSFIRSVRRACERGVQVAIGFGLGEDDNAEKRGDAEARRKLENLANDVGALTVRRLGDTHAKVLVKDSEFFVITSFNWLSFRGDPARPFREEWGTIVRDAALVDEFYTEMIKRFD